MRASTYGFPLSFTLMACLLASCGGGNNGTDSSSGSTDGSGGSAGSGGGAGSGGSGGEAGSGGSGGGSASGVTGTAKDTYTTLKDSVVVPVKPTKWTSIEAMVEQGGSATSYPGTLSPDGALVIPNVPEVPYWLVLTAPPPADVPGASGLKTFIATSSRTLDLGSLYSFRMDVEPITQPTLVELNASLAQPWQAFAEDGQGNVVQELDDYVQIVSFNADVNGGGVASFDVPGSPVNGDMALSGWQMDASEIFLGANDGRPHLIRTDKGDDIAVLHNVASKVTAPGQDPWANYVYYAAKAIFKPASAVMSNGATTPLDGSFAAVPSKMLSFDYKGSQFNKALEDAPTTDLYSASVGFNVFLEPHATNVAYGGFATLLDFTIFSVKQWADPVCNPDSCDPAACPAGCSDASTFALPADHTNDFAYGNPFNFGQEIASLNVGIRVDVTPLLPADQTTERLAGSIALRMPAAQLSGAPVVPVVGLPRNVTVNGMPTPVDQVTKVGTTPELAFTPPTIGTPTYYTARLIALDDVKDANDNVILRNRSVALFYLTGTSMKIPDGVLKAGKNYYLQVTAYAHDIELSAPFYAKPNFARGQTFTGIITP